MGERQGRGGAWIEEESVEKKSSNKGGEEEGVIGGSEKKEECGMKLKKNEERGKN